MKKNVSKMLRSVLAMLLVVSMAVGFVPSVVFAQTESTPAKKYVSLGDSMTNGYGLEGYDAVGRVNGFLEEVPSAYPALLAEKYGWDLTQLATSAMRAEDLHYILEYGRKDDAYQGDEYTMDEFVNNRWNDYAGINNDYAGVENVAEVFQNAVAEADVISMAVGNSNFGVFMLGRIQNALGILGKNPADNEWVAFEKALAECNEETKVQVLTVYEVLKAEVAKSLPAELGEPLVEIVAYCVASYMLNFSGSIEAIVELNPDAEIIIVGLMNNYGSVSLSYNGEVYDLGALLGKAIDAANAYLSALPATLQMLGKYPEATFYYAEAESVAVIVDEFANEIYGDNAVRVRTIEEVVSMVWPMLNAMNIANGDEPMYVNITRGEVEAYEAAYAAGPAAYAQVLAPVIAGNQDALKKLQSITTYLAFEKAIIEGAQLDVMEGEAFLTLVAGLDGIFNGIYGQFEANIAERMTTDTELQNFAVQTLKVIEAGMGAPDGYVSGDTTAIAKVCLLVALPDAMSDALVADDTLLTLLSLFARMLIGNGIGCHPSAKGHESLFNAVVDAYDAKHTAKDEAIKDAKVILDELYNLMKEYGPDAAKQVWAQWEAQGYVAAVESSINNVINAAKFRYAYYTESVLPAIDAAIADLNAEKDALVVELATLNALLAAKEAELADVLAKQEIGSVTVPEINFDITAEVGGNTPSTVPGYDCEAGEGAVAELNAAIADLKHAIAVVEALIADAGADVADMAALAAQIATAIAPLGETVEEIVAAGEDLLEAFWAIREVLTNDSAAKTVETVVSVFNSARSTALAATKVVELTGTAASLAFDDIDAMVDMVIADAEALATKIVADIPASLANAPEEVLAAVAVAKIVADIARTTAGDYVEGAIDAQIEALIADATAKYEAGKADLEAHIIEKSAVVEGILAQLDAHVAAKFPGVKAEAEKQFAALIVMKADLEAELQALKADLEAKVIALANETEATIEAAIAPIKAQIARVEKDLATIENDLACAVEHLAAAKEALVIYVNELVISVNDQVKNTISGVVTEMKETVIAMGENALAELVDLAVAGINKLLMQATTTDLVVDDDFTYVALGDGSAAADSYVELLAALLGEGALANGVDAIDFVNAAKTGNTVISVRENLPAEIATADLITLGFSNVNFLANAIINVGTERDWAKLVGEENVPYVMELLAEVEAKVAEAGLSGDMAATVNSIIEGFAYCNVEYAVELPKLISNIKAVNPDAVIVIVGMYNPLKDATLVVEGATIEISEYIDYLVEGTAIHGLVYSLISGDSIYVNVGDVATLNTKTELGMADLLSLVATGFAPLNPSAVGDDYIAAEIADALNITYVKSEVEVLLGDVNGDGVVDAKDVTRLRKYMADPDTTEINFKNADVNLDGVVDAKDMTRMRKHFADGVAFG